MKSNILRSTQDLNIKEYTDFIEEKKSNKQREDLRKVIIGDQKPIIIGKIKEDEIIDAYKDK